MFGCHGQQLYFGAYIFIFIPFLTSVSKKPKENPCFARAGHKKRFTYFPPFQQNILTFSSLALPHCLAAEKENRKSCICSDSQLGAYTCRRTLCPPPYDRAGPIIQLQHSYFEESGEIHMLPYTLEVQGISMCFLYGQNNGLLH